MKFWIVTSIALIIIVLLGWQLAESVNRVQIQQKQIEAYKVLVTETEKERDASQKKFDGLISDLKDWANKNQSALSAKQYSTFTDCNTRVGGGLSCFSY